ncbi:hypothetical protein F5146DRAFT_168543 [Armillaria mellea]|nr:hypothetical protein F5146DRAFT_168543 [Armillaria mellea]
MILTTTPIVALCCLRQVKTVTTHTSSTRNHHPCFLHGPTTSWNQHSHEQNSVFGLQYRERERNGVSLSDSNSQLKSPLTPSNWIDYPQYHPNADVLSSPVSTSKPVAAEKKRQDARSNVTSVSYMNSEADVVKLKQAAPARCDTGADASQAVDQRIGIDADDEDAASTERWMQGLVIGESPPGYYQ